MTLLSVRANFITLVCSSLSNPPAHARISFLPVVVHLPHPLSPLQPPPGKIPLSLSLSLSLSMYRFSNDFFLSGAANFAPSFYPSHVHRVRFRLPAASQPPSTLRISRNPCRRRPSSPSHLRFSHSFFFLAFLPFHSRVHFLSLSLSRLTFVRSTFLSRSSPASSLH